MIYIEVDGENYPLHYGFDSVDLLMSKAQLTKYSEAAELVTNYPMKELPVLVKAGLDTGAEVLNRKPPFTQKEVKDLLQLNLWMGYAAVNEFQRCFLDPASAPKKNEEAATEVTENLEKVDAGN